MTSTDVLFGTPSLTLAARNEPAARRAIATIAVMLGTGFPTAAALTARDLLLPAG